jgi:5-methylcytosine-specific restriction endonuclease McrA
MTTIFDSATSSLSDDQLLASVKSLARAERKATADLIAALAEVDRRKLYLGEGFPSLFNYCTQVLQLSEHAAYGRIEAVRVVHRFPIVLEHLADGAVTLTSVCLLAPLLTPQNHEALLAGARHKSRREVEHLVAMTRPKPDVPAVVRRLPSSRSQVIIEAPTLDVCTPSAAPIGAASEIEPRSAIIDPVPMRPAAHDAVVVPLTPERYKIQFTASREAHDKLRRAQSLLRHVIPNGDPAAVFERALDALLADIERKKLAATSRPHQARPTAPGSRHIPASVRREVWRRDGARCAFVGAAGRCAERGFLELHHVVPFAMGGEATIANIELRCRAHNAYEAEQVFGSFVLRERQPEYNSVRTECRTGTTVVRLEA